MIRLRDFSNLTISTDLFEAATGRCLDAMYPDVTGTMVLYMSVLEPPETHALS